MKAEWLKDRFNWIDSEGVPLEPDWSQCSSAKTLDEQADLDAVQSLSELKADGKEKDDLKGPSNEVGGVKYESLQLCLPEFGEMDPSLQDDMQRACYLQLDPKQRALEFQVSELVTEQTEKFVEKCQKKHEEKVMKARARAVMLASWNKRSEKAMEDDGRSRLELIEELVPSVKRKKVNDPAEKAVNEFMKLQKEYEA